MVYQADPRRLQSYHNDIEKDDDDVKFPLVHMKKMQNTAKVRTSPSNRTAPLTKGVVGRKRVDVSVKKVICIKG